MKKTLFRWMLLLLAGASLAVSLTTFAIASEGLPPTNCHQSCNFDTNLPCNGQACNTCTWQSYMNYTCEEPSGG